MPLKIKYFLTEKIKFVIILMYIINFAPKIHSLLRLLEKTELNILEEDKDVLADMNRFNIAGRYAESLYPVLSKTNAIKHLNAAKKTLKWLKNQL